MQFASVKVEQESRSVPVCFISWGEQCTYLTQCPSPRRAYLHTRLRSVGQSAEVNEAEPDEHTHTNTLYMAAWRSQTRSLGHAGHVTPCHTLLSGQHKCLGLSQEAQEPASCTMSFTGVYTRPLSVSSRVNFVAQDRGLPRWKTFSLGLLQQIQTCRDLLVRYSTLQQHNCFCKEYIEHS